MKHRRLLLTCLAAAAFAFTGCDKVQNLLKRSKPETVQTAGEEPPSAAAAVPTPEPAAAAPTPTVETANRNASVIVYCYHRFEDPARDALAITSAEFEAQMQALKDAGVEVIGMQDFLAWRRGEKAIPEKSAIITIDDGYSSGYHVAWPILKKFGYPFTMFVYIDYIGIGGKAISWDQLAEMRDAGVDIQSHTYSHQDLRGHGVIKKQHLETIKRIGYDAWLKKELAESRRVLETKLGIRVNALAYPYGNHNEAVHKAAQEAGYEVAFSVYGQRIGFSHPGMYLIGRYAVTSRDAQVFNAGLKAISGPAGSEGPAVAQLAAASMATQPMQGEVVTDPKPLIKANLATMGAIDPGSVEMRISGYGLVPAEYDEATRMISYQPTAQPLREKDYTVIISAKVGGKKVETNWSFQFNPAGAAKP